MLDTITLTLGLLPKNIYTQTFDNDITYDVYITMRFVKQRNREYNRD